MQSISNLAAAAWLPFRLPILLSGVLAAFGGAWRTQADDPIITLQFVDGNGALTLRLRADEARQLPEFEMTPGLSWIDGEYRYVLTNAKSKTETADQVTKLPPAIMDVVERQTKAVLAEIRQHCAPSPSQRGKLEVAAAAEPARLLRRIKQLNNQSVVVSKASEQEIENVVDMLNEVNSMIEQGVTRKHSLFRNVCQTVLDDNQMSLLRQAYLQPLLKILRDSEAISHADQHYRLEQLIRESNIEVFDLRNNYARQYRFVSELATSELDAVFSQAQLAAFKALERSDYRITHAQFREAKRQ